MKSTKNKKSQKKSKKKSLSPSPLPIKSKFSLSRFIYIIVFILFIIFYVLMMYFGIEMIISTDPSSHVGGYIMIIIPNIILLIIILYNSYSYQPVYYNSGMYGPGYGFNNGLLTGLLITDIAMDAGDWGGY